ncbi:FAD/NADP-binding domain-containing protein [Dacryopinax primogenitus]|uniref:FAD/NADP-binding domain-containing protein n=1 Tax=Dacryopinax primogenitus (strain DJM 731) TaxID=1858805 RepID=M5FVM1_DACPD|nr:FAD/NADP-binding domain-containing protein [Dacryopinax primogenitus]EJT97391.1 FAD/NADP-binding domain-containing protein [Dacryopinax primogenitus]
MSTTGYPHIAIIGCGASGITAALHVREQLGLNSFTIFERNGGPGGVWLENTYPGAACDVPSQYYSSASTLNPSWSSHYSGRSEIQAYWAKLHSEQGLDKHTRYHLECKRAIWSDRANQWTLTFCNGLNDESIDVVADIIIAGIGGFSIPNMQTDSLPGIDTFRGPVFHTSRWNHSIDLRGKRVGVIGNGCSAAQLVPALSADPSTEVINFVRTPQWYLRRHNEPFSAWIKWVYRNVPLANRLARWILLLVIDMTSPMFHRNGTKLRTKTEKNSAAYIRQTAPEKYMDFLIPKFSLGAKRMIYDPGYLESLHRPNVQLVYNNGITQVTEYGVILKNGETRKLDVIVLATGFDTVTFLTSMVIRGRNGADLKEVWDKKGGAEAYYCSLVPQFPNLYMLGGPNSASGFQSHKFTSVISVIFMVECQVRFVCKVIQHMLQVKASYVEPTPQADARFNSWVQKELQDTVYGMDKVQSWYKTASGKIHTVWPKSGLAFYWMMMFPKWDEMEFVGGRRPDATTSFVLAWTALIAAVFGVCTQYSLSHYIKNNSTSTPTTLGIFEQRFRAVCGMEKEEG